MKKEEIRSKIAEKFKATINSKHNLPEFDNQNKKGLSHYDMLP
jgi:hypothetical protein